MTTPELLAYIRRVALPEHPLQRIHCGAITDTQRDELQAQLSARYGRAVIVRHMSDQTKDAQGRDTGLIGIEPGVFVHW